MPNREEPSIVIVESKKLLGMKSLTSLENSQTFELWQKFMTERRNIKHRLNEDLYSVQIYLELDSIYDFNPNSQFEKWAAVEVDAYENLPLGMEKLLLEGGLYAHYTHVGLAENYFAALSYVLNDWLPQSDYSFDITRAQYEVMGAKYDPRSTDSEEEIWIPVEINV